MNKHTSTLKKFKQVYKEFEFTAHILKGIFDETRKNNGY